jgi:signal transduction histidine kinase
VSGKMGEAEALAEIGRLITSSTDFGEVFEATADRISALIPAETVSLSTVDLDRNTYRTLFDRGTFAPTSGVRPPRSLSGTAGEVAVTSRTPQIISKKLIAKQAKNWAGVGEYPVLRLKSWLIAPLIVGGNVIGLIHLRTTEPDSYTDQHVLLLERIANQIAGPIALVEANRALVKSDFDQSALALLAFELSSAESAEEMYESIDHALAGFFDFDRISIVTVDMSSGNLIQRYQRGIDVPWIEVGTVLTGPGSSEKFHEWANELTETSKGGHYLGSSPPRATYKDLGIESRMRVPLLTSTGYLGAIALNHTKQSKYAVSDQSLFKRIGEQVAPALEKSFLLERAEDEAKTQQSLARIGRVVAEDLNLDSVYERMADELEKLVPYDRVSVSLFDPGSQAMTTDFFRGISIPQAMPGDDITDLAKTVDWSFEGGGSETVESLTEKEAAFVRTLNNLGLVSWIQAPFGVQATGPIGFLSVRSTIPNNYDEHDLQLLRQVAVQVTPAIQNARLFEQSMVLSEQRERASGLDEENRELQRVADARSQFLSTVSHELRTPLTAISAFSDILSHNSSGNLEERQLTHIDAIRRSTVSLTSLVNDLLDVSRADSGRLSLERKPFDFREFISEFTGVAESLAAHKQQTVTVSNLDGIIWLYGDQSRITQILNNLLSNACKYSPDRSEITINVTSQSGKIEVELTDQGIGIAPHNIGSVFVPFFRAENPETQKQSGTGLGLSVVKTLAELHGGGIQVESQLNQGTTVKFWLPAVVDAP